MATRIGTFPQAVDADLFSENSATPNHQLGSKVTADDGREFRYCRVGATALVPGKLYQASAEDTGTQNLAVAAAAIGATSVTTTSTVTVTANEYADGFLLVTVTPGQGYMYKIKSHPAASGAAVTLTLWDPIQVALTTSSRIDLVRNPYAGVVVNPTTATSAPVGAAVYPVTALYYGWLQVGGVCSLLADGANAVGSNLVASNGVAGAVEDAASPGAQPLVGTAVTGAADTEYGAVFLNLE